MPSKLASLPDVMYNKELVDAMRTDSCRRCGKTLEANKKCHICNKATEFFCHNCGHITIEQIHSQCMIIDVSHTMSESAIKI
jgi:hypothetical protein